jgi:DNA-binding NarL/FixJ family response regulator
MCPSPAPVRALLLIEDDASFADLVQQLFRTQTDWHLAHVATLADGVKFLALHRCTLVILDLNLPDSRELATLSTLLAACPGVPIVVLTIVEHDGLSGTIEALGGCGYISKWEVAEQPSTLVPLIEALLAQ